jgi:hypothetical protein
MRFAFADPPYPGKAGYYPERQEVDHGELIARLSSTTCTPGRAPCPRRGGDTRVPWWHTDASPSAAALLRRRLRPSTTATCCLRLNLITAAHAGCRYRSCHEGQSGQQRRHPGYHADRLTPGRSGNEADHVAEPVSAACALEWEGQVSFDDALVGLFGVVRSCPNFGVHMDLHGANLFGANLDADLRSHSAPWRCAPLSFARAPAPRTDCRMTS